MLLRCTTRLLALLDERAVVLVDDPPHEEDWYANLLWLDWRKCLLLMHSGTLFPVFIADVRTSDMRPLGPLVTTRIKAALADEGLPADVLGPLDPGAIALARTASRRILGFMNETALTCRYAIDAAGGLEHTEVNTLERFLRRELHNFDGYRQPIELVRHRLERKPG